ncbi:unnamed protein product [Choristocarpus tenellus]
MAIKEFYREAVDNIDTERGLFLDKISLVQPSFEEEHRLEWERQCQEEELCTLKDQMETVSEEVEKEVQFMGERERVITEIRREQHEDRIKIQTLLALSQPITPDITILFESLGGAPQPLCRSSRAVATATSPAIDETPITTSGLAPGSSCEGQQGGVLEDPEGTDQSHVIQTDQDRSLVRRGPSGRSEGGNVGSEGGRRDAQRCTRGYYEYLNRKVEMTQV